ncbi:MAG TPA: glutamate-cysteine ligase family protein, partial [Egibacteraceae bacterium]|nr:glutamate-cysteine ligase family protein [Egibacteraceae bacterium]
CVPQRPGAPALGGVGLELEVFPVAVGDGGAPAGRLRLSETVAVLDTAVPRSATGDGVPRWSLPGGGRLVPEPGGQVEHVTPVHRGVGAALDDLAAGAAVLAAAFGSGRRQVVLASAGLDVWHPVASVAQQLAAARYPAMAAYLARRGPMGRVMMCHTCALQVNLDLGPPAVAVERWRVALLVAPLLVATFAASPVPAGLNGRSLAWQALDPTRTGFPRRFLAGDDDPVAVIADAALAADVMLVRRPGGAVPGRPGWRFGSWLRDGDAEHGRPTADDLDYHLTTLFHEVRARGFLEVRSVDALPARWRAAPVTLLAGLVYDDRARHAVLSLLERHRRRLPQLLARAAVSGVADPALCALTVEAWSFALAGAGRLGPGYLAPSQLRATEAFLERFTLRGRCPADELRACLTESATAALAWASDPLETAAATAERSR